MAAFAHHRARGLQRAHGRVTLASGEQHRGKRRAERAITRLGDSPCDEPERHRPRSPTGGPGLWLSPGYWSLASANGVLPGCQDSVDGGPHLPVGDRAGYAGHQQLVIVGVLVPHRGHHRQRHRILIQRAPRRDRPTRRYSRTAACRAIAAARPAGQAGNNRPPPRPAAPRTPHPGRRGAAGRARGVGCGVLVGQALRLGLLQGRLLHQDPLALVALAGAAEAHHHRRQPARLLGAPAQRRVAGGQEDRWPRSAQSMHRGPAPSMNNSQPEPPQAVQLHSFNGSITTRSGGLLLPPGQAFRAAAGRSARIQWVRQASSVAQTVGGERSGRRRSRVAAT